MYRIFLFCRNGIAYSIRCALLPVVIFQISAHWIIRAEERECIKKFGIAYEQYMKKPRRHAALQGRGRSERGVRLRHCADL